MRNFVIIDFETTRNALTRKESIVEIAALKTDEDFNILSEFHTLVNPSCELTDITKIKTGLDDPSLKCQKSFRDIFPELISFIGDNILIAHNALFDCRVLFNSSKDIFPGFYPVFIDSLKIMNMLFPGEKCDLESIKKKFNVTFLHHRALEDVRSLNACLKKANILYKFRFNKSIKDDLDLFKLNDFRQSTNQKTLF